MEKHWSEYTQEEHEAAEVRYDQLLHRYREALELIMNFKHAYQQQGELDDNALGCVFDMYDAARKALDHEKNVVS